MTGPASVLICEPSDIIVDGLTAALSAYRSFNVLSSLRDVSLLQERLTTQSPDLLLVNPTLWAAPARPSIVSLQQARPATVWVALVYQYVEPQLLSLFKTVVDIRESRNRVPMLLEEACNATGDEPSSGESYELSERETEVLVLLAQGLSSKEIADKLNISVHTVSTHRKNITRKTDIKSIAGLAVYATLHNLT